jgi:putative transcriptional regulator
MDSLQGQLLLASPDLRDPNFFHTVVLLVRHNEEGALGLVLNRPLNVRLGQVWKEIGVGPAARNDVIHLGGPCEGPLMALQDKPEFGESEVVPGVYFCTNRELLELVVGDASQQARFFAGFSGWGPGQLEKEMDEASWLVLPAAAVHVYDAETDLWSKLMRELSGREILSTLHIRHVPPDLRMN